MAASVSAPRHWNSPLPDASKYIRLLRIPDQLDHTGEISLRSETVLLSAGIKCYALSYTWGCPFFDSVYDSEHLLDYEDCLPITCDENEAQVKRNLYEGLKEIITQFPGSLLWIDALCIDQANEQELKAQLVIMGDIYFNAMTVLVWLGKDLRNNVSNVYTLLQSMPGITQIIKTKPTGEAIKTVVDGVGALETMLKCSWFYRKWTFQEIVLAKKNVILCGSFSFNIEQLNELLLICGDFELIQVMSQSSIELMILFQLTYSSLTKLLLKIKETRALLYQAPLQNSRMTAYLDLVCGDRSFCSHMMLLISMSSPREASKTLDLFLSLGGLCKMLSGVEDANLISPSWSGIRSLIYLTMRLATDLPFLTVLSYADGYQEAYPEQPTWILKQFHDQRHGFQPIIEKACSQHTMFYNASLVGSGPSESWKRCRFDTEGRFAIRAVRAGFIRHLKSGDLKDSGSENEKNIPIERWKATPLLGIADFVQELSLNLIVRPGIALKEALWRTLIADIGKDGCFPASDIDHLDYIGWICYHNLAASYNKRHAAEELDGQRDLEQQEVNHSTSYKTQPDDVFSILFPGVESSQSPASENADNEAVEISNKADMTNDKVKAQLSSVMGSGLIFESRTMFPDRSLIKVEGEGGDMIGLTDPRVTIEDEVWIIQNAKVPFVLRKTDVPGQYRLIGEAYVHGIMCGEFIRERGDDVGWQEIYLR